MIRFTPAVRLSLGLVVLTLSLLVLAQALGLAPSTERQQLNMREQLAETLAAQANIAIQKGDLMMLRTVLNTTVARNREVNSAAVRRRDGVFVAKTSQHKKYWQDADHQGSTPTHIRLPIIEQGAKRATVEIAFKPLTQDRHPLLHLPTFILLLVFVAVAGFVGFWLYIKRVLKHLDPSAVVPARVRNALNILAEGVLILDRREQIVLANNAFAQRLRSSEKSLLGKKASQLGWQLDASQHQQYPWLSAMETGKKQVGVRVAHSAAHHKDRIYRINVVPIIGAKSQVQGTIAVFDDITELEEKNQMLKDTVAQLAATQVDLKNKNQELLLLATRDPLTNCANRRALHKHLEGKFDGERASDGDFSCIMMDIDFFKKVNDNYGHALGDEVLKAVASSLRDVVRDIDLVARVGGEEFCIILPGIGLEQARTIAERCRVTVAAKQIGSVRVTGSFGVANLRQSASNSDELLQQADEALYYSKRQGRNRVSCWQPDMKSLGDSH